jgi:hypothetical protein
MNSIIVADISVPCLKKGVFPNLKIGNIKLHRAKEIKIEKHIEGTINARHSNTIFAPNHKIGCIFCNKHTVVTVSPLFNGEIIRTGNF